MGSFSGLFTGVEDLFGDVEEEHSISCGPDLPVLPKDPEPAPEPKTKNKKQKSKKKAQPVVVDYGSDDEDGGGGGGPAVPTPAVLDNEDYAAEVRVPQPVPNVVTKRTHMDDETAQRIAYVMVAVVSIMIRACRKMTVAAGAAVKAASSRATEVQQVKKVTLSDAIEVEPQREQAHDDDDDDIELLDSPSDNNNKKRRLYDETLFDVSMEMDGLLGSGAVRV